MGHAALLTAGNTEDLGHRVDDGDVGATTHQYVSSTARALEWAPRGVVLRRCCGFGVSSSLLWCVRGFCEAMVSSGHVMHCRWQQTTWALFRGILLLLLLWPLTTMLPLKPRHEGRRYQEALRLPQTSAQNSACHAHLEIVRATASWQTSISTGLPSIVSPELMGPAYSGLLSSQTADPWSPL